MHKFQPKKELSFRLAHFWNVNYATATLRLGKAEIACGLSFKVAGTIMAIIYFLSSGKPTLAFPNITFAQNLFYDGNPPIKEDKYHGTNAPFNQNQNRIVNSEHQKPEATMLALDIRQLDMSATAFRTLLV